MVVDSALAVRPAPARRVLRWLAVFPAAILGFAAAGLATDLVRYVEDVSPVADALRNWLGPKGVGQLLDAFFLPLVLICVGARVAPSGKRIVAAVLAALYVASNVWLWVQAAQAGVTLEMLAGDVGMTVTVLVLQILGIVTGVRLAASGPTAIKPIATANPSEVFPVGQQVWDGVRGKRATIVRAADLEAGPVYSLEYEYGEVGAEHGYELTPWSAGDDAGLRAQFEYQQRFIQSARDFAAREPETRA